MILFFGDSHTAAFVIQENNSMIPDLVLIKNGPFNSYRTWPYTCFNIDTKFEILTGYLSELKLTKDDIVFFSYGETDLRCHIGPNSFDTLQEDENISSIVNKYVHFLNMIKKQFDFDVGCYGPIASGIHNGPNGNDSIPSYSNSIERNKITVKFNNELKKKCKEKGIIYKDIFRHLVYDNFETKNEYYGDKIHLGFNARKLLLNEFQDIIQKFVE